MPESVEAKSGEEWHTINKPQRWDIPFWRETLSPRRCQPMKHEDVKGILEREPFSRIDPDRFPRSLSLEGILLNDARIRRFAKGEIVVRQGDYGNSAFFVLSGSVQVLLESVDDALLGRRKLKKNSFFSALTQLWKNPKTPERRKFRGEGSLSTVPSVFGRPEDELHTTVFLQDVSAVLQGVRSSMIKEGDLFGEIAALTRTPRTATIIAAERSNLLEIRWQGLRDIRQRSSELKAHIDQLYRERSLNAHLFATPMFRHLSEDEMKQVAAATEFQTYGNYDWNVSYSKDKEMSPAQRLQYEPVVAREGHYPNGVFLIRSGFARLSETYNHGERTVSYLGRGQVFGFEEVAYNGLHNKQVPFQRTLRGVGYVDMLYIPTSVIEKFVLPNIDPKEIPDFEALEKSVDTPGLAAMKDQMNPDLLEFLVERRFINGTATMIIDMERCTRCDDCVRACASTHNNNPRFLRQGPIMEGYMVANACMHCQDPVCMIGCPTGAIHRSSAEGQVVINDDTCIGCATCANACPYDNIQVVAARDASGQVVYDELNSKPIEKATKCDLCVDQWHGPACANACPHDALIRADMLDWEKLSNWFRK